MNPSVGAPVSGGADERPSRVWRSTGILLGVLVYVGVVILDIAGFTEALPFVIIPPLLVVMIGGGVLLGGGQHGRRARAQATPRPLTEYGHPRGTRATLTPTALKGSRMTVATEDEDGEGTGPAGHAGPAEGVEGAGPPGGAGPEATAGPVPEGPEEAGDRP